MHAVCYLPLSNAETGPKKEGTDYEESSQKSLFLHLFTNLLPMNDFRCFSSPGSIWTNKIIQNSLRPKSAGEWNWTVWTALRKLEHLYHVHEVDYVHTTSSGCTAYVFTYISPHGPFASRVFKLCFPRHVLAHCPVSCVQDAGWAQQKTKRPWTQRASVNL